MEYRSSNNLSENFNIINSVDFKSLTQSMHVSLNKINSDTILIDKGFLKLQNQIVNFEKINLSKNNKLLNAKAILKFKPNADEMTYAAKVNLSLNSENILVFNIVPQEYIYKEFFSLKDVPKMLRFFLAGLTENSDLYNQKSNAIKLVGTLNLNTTKLNLEAADTSNLFKFNSNINILKSLEQNELLFKKFELVLGDYALFSSNSSFNFVERSFDVNVTKLLMPYENTSIFSKEFKVFGVFPPKEEIISKINIVGENPSSLKASLDIMRSSDLSDDEQTSFDFFVKLDAIKKIRLNNFLGL